MSKYINTELFERLFFTMIVVGILASAFGAIKYFDISNQIANNEAAQIRAEGGEVAIESKSDARGLMAADLELRDLIRERSNMIVVGGIGLALLGGGWFLMDMSRARRNRKREVEAPTQSVAEATT